MKNMQDKGVLAYTLFTIAGFLLGALVMFFAERALAPSTIDAAPNSTDVHATSTKEVGGSDSFVVPTQTAGLSVSTGAVRMPVDGWIVVHEIRDGHIGNALGAARRDTGTYDNVTIELLRATIPEREYMVILYKDNGNRIFEVKIDLPVINTDGNPVMQSFAATVQ